MTQRALHISLIGSGNVAGALGKAFSESGLFIDHVISRNSKTGTKLAKSLNCRFSQNYSSIDKNTDIIIIAVSDDAIKEVAGQVPKIKGIIVHTSGSVSLETLSVHKKRGVFYPVQTITSSRKTTFGKVPICIEAGDETTLTTLLQLGKSISEDLHVLNSEQRAVLHLSAVITNNFTNYLMSEVMHMMDDASLSHDLLKPLALATIKRAFDENPDQIQTGPARRKDRKTIETHLRMLRDNPGFSKLYEMLSGLILKKYNSNQNSKIRKK